MSVKGRVVRLMLLFIVALGCAGCNDEDNVVITPVRLERISVGDDTADSLIEKTIEGKEAVNEGLDAIELLNCTLGFSSCLTVTEMVTVTVDLWGGD